MARSKKQGRRASHPDLPPHFFINVDLDIEDGGDVEPLLKALEPHALSLGRPAGSASFELHHPVTPKDPEQLILEFVRLVGTLPPPAREVWNRASRRVFDIGFQSVRVATWAEVHRLSSRTLAAVTAVGAEIAITVYALRHPDGAHERGESQKLSAE